MKKVLLVLSMAALLMVSGIVAAKAQDEPKPKKDTVNMDTNAKPEFYFATEDEDADKKGGSGVLIAIIGGVVVVGAAAAFFILKKKK